jgi:(S)-ureidoglycine aminohydrolase
MIEPCGSTRTTVKANYAVLTPDSFVAHQLPGWKDTACVVSASPALGAQSTQLLATLDKEGVGEGNTGADQYFLYAIDGAGSIVLNDRRTRLEPGSYVYLPPDTDMQIKSGGTSLQLLVFQKRYEPAPGARPPAAIAGHERDIKGHAFHGDVDAHVQILLPVDAAFDMEANILTFQPGAALPAVQSQIQERGLLMLKGQGICRLESDWHPVKAGDVIRAGPACPFWFAAIGKTPASLIYFTGVNRDPR